MKTTFRQALALILVLSAVSGMTASGEEKNSPSSQKGNSNNAIMSFIVTKYCSNKGDKEGLAQGARKPVVKSPKKRSSKR